MASSMLSSATMVASPAQATMVAPFNGLKSSAAFPATRKANNDITSITSNGGRVNCMQVIYISSFTFLLFHMIFFGSFFEST
jgi:ribulose-bisphosphate carboxylase small chain|uniref:AT1G67090 protein n=1 Tax=Arabidopsis thaliana TaxID=3702 RepID=C0Z396_ARATH|nr:AT1G67090 [Arabidopsis thaliana]